MPKPTYTLYGPEERRIVPEPDGFIRKAAAQRKYRMSETALNRLIATFNIPTYQHPNDKRSVLLRVDDVDNALAEKPRPKHHNPSFRR